MDTDEIVTDAVALNDDGATALGGMDLVGTALFNGVSQGLQPLASQVHGSGDPDGEKRIIRHALQIGVGMRCV